MSTYNTRKIENPELKKFNVNRDKAIKILREWMNNQSWVKNDILTWDTTLRGMKENEIMVLIHCSGKADTVLENFKKTNFKKKGLNIKFSNIEQASWNSFTYFIDFEYLG